MRAIWLVCFWFLSFQSEAALSQQLAPSTPGSTPEKSQPETPPKAASVRRNHPVRFRQLYQFPMVL